MNYLLVNKSPKNIIITRKEHAKSNRKPMIWFLRKNDKTNLKIEDTLLQSFFNFQQMKQSIQFDLKIVQAHGIEVKIRKNGLWILYWTCYSIHNKGLCSAGTQHSHNDRDIFSWNVCWENQTSKYLLVFVLAECSQTQRIE